jgi:hypothetical protein
LDLNNDLIRLGHDIEDAADSLRQACRLACGLVGDDPDRGLDGWPAMEALVTRLDELEKQVAALPGEEIAAAIRDAHAYLDHLSDLADGQSY